MEPNFEKYYYKDFDFVPVSFLKNSFRFTRGKYFARLNNTFTLTAILPDCDRFDGKNMISCFCNGMICFHKKPNPSSLASHLYMVVLHRIWLGCAVVVWQISFKTAYIYLKEVKFEMPQVMAREQGDIHPSDVDLLSPGFLDPPATQAPSPHSVVSTWSQLSQGSRLSADSSYRDDLLLPCSRDPSSEEGSDTRDLSDEELEPVNELSQDTAVLTDNGCDGKGMEGDELERNPEGSKEDKKEALADVRVEAHTLLENVAVEEVKMGQGENPPCDNDEQIPGVAIKCVTANDKETTEVDKEVQREAPVETTEVDKEVQRQAHVEATEVTQTAPLLDIKDLDNVIEDVIIPNKKKNKKRRKHAKKKKPGTIDQEDDEEEEDVPVEA